MMKKWQHIKRCLATVVVAIGFFAPLSALEIATQEEVQPAQPIPDLREVTGLPEVTDLPEVTVAFGYDKAPYVIDQLSTGYYIETTRRAFERIGYKLKPVYLSLNRMKAGLVGDKFDAAAGLPPAKEGFCNSSPFVMYKNIAIVSNEVADDIHEISDLRAVSVVAFQQARTVYGEEFTAMADNNPRYIQVASQKQQVRSFLAGRFDVATMDKNIFYWWSAFLTETGVIPEKAMGYTVKRIFPWKENFGLQFKDTKLCAAFSASIDAMREAGEIQALKDHYFSEKWMASQAKKLAQQK